MQIAVGQSLSDSMQVTTVCACRCHHAEYLTAPDHCDTSNHPDQLSNRTMHVQLTATAAPLPPAAHAWPPAFGDPLSRSAHTRLSVGSMQGRAPCRIHNASRPLDHPQGAVCKQRCPFPSAHPYLVQGCCAPAVCGSVAQLPVLGVCQKFPELACFAQHCISEQLGCIWRPG